MNKAEQLFEKYLSKGILLALAANNEQLSIKGNVKLLSDQETNELLTEKQLLLKFLKKRKLLAEPIARVEANDSHELSIPQKRLWVIGQSEQRNAAYNMNGCYIFSGKVDKEKLQSAFLTLIARHEILRTCFQEKADGTLHQIVLPFSDVDFEISYKDMRNIQFEQIKNEIAEQQKLSFSFCKGELIRAGLYRYESEKYLFSFSMHHIISDGWSIEILIKELVIVYNSLVSKVDDPLVPLNIQYKDYAEWHRKIVELSTDRDKEYWLRMFAQEIPVLNLQGDIPSCSERRFEAGKISRRLSSVDFKEFKLLLKQEKCTLYVGLIALSNVLLFHYTNQKDIVIGTPFSGREHPDLNDQIGFYVNTIALRTKFEPYENFRQVLLRVKEIVIDSLAHQYYPFDRLIEDLSIKGIPDHGLLFDVWVVLNTVENAVSNNTVNQFFTEFSVQEYKEIDSSKARYNLSFDFKETKDGIELELIYNTDLYSDFYIASMFDCMETLLTEIVREPGKPISVLELISVGKKNQFLQNISHQIVLDQVENSVISLFRSQVKKNQENIAVVVGNYEVTYKELNLISDNIAIGLLNICKVQKGDIVALHLERGVEMIASMIAIMKIGAAFLPLEIDLPQARIDYMVKDSGCKTILDKNLLLRIKQGADTDSVITYNPSKEDLVYIIYTSGTTGQPKGVKITNMALTDYVLGLQKVVDFSECRSFGVFSTLAADLGYTSVFSAIALGKTLIIYNEVGNFDQSEFDKQPDCIKIVPSHWNAIKVIPRKTIIFGGERLTSKIIEEVWKINPNISIYNHYGPTEATIGKIIHKVLRTEKEIPLGKPFGNNYVYILNESGNLVAPGMIGEICIGGDGLSSGYLFNDSLSNERFIPDPFLSERLIYKTGDFGRWNKDNDIEFIGRLDNQIKLRGYRVDIFEVETVIKNVTKAESVVVRKNTENNEVVGLFAYILKQDRCKQDLSLTLLEYLPSYMVPSHFFYLEEFPLTKNGKINLEQLPLPCEESNRDKEKIHIPSSETEEKLLQIWSEVLDIDRKNISVSDNFLDLGGHSIKAIKVILLIHKEFNVRLDLGQFFNSSTIVDVANEIDQIRWLKDSTNVSEQNETQKIII